MSRPNWRDFPPVELIDRPSRLSVTFLKHANGCPLSGYFYLRDGSPPSNDLDRGTALHLFCQEVPALLLAHAEAHREGAPEEAVPVEPVLETDAAKDLMNQVLDEHPELGVTVEDAVKLRQMAYHLAGDDRGRAGQRKPDDRPYPVGYAWRPDEIVAVERTFLLEIAGWRVIGRVDLAHLDRDMLLDVEDFRSSLHVPTAAEYDGSLPTKLYVALVMLGNPVGPEGVLEPSIGEFVQWARATEVFPRYLRDDGSVTTRSVIYSREEILEFVEDLERLVRAVDAALEPVEVDAGDSEVTHGQRWPAIRGSHCNLCPRPADCPIPERLRSHAGLVNDLERASEALEWADGQAALVNATRREVREFAKRQQLTIPVGADEEYGFVVTQTRKVDAEGMEAAAARSAQFGEPFDAESFIKRSTRTEFKKVKVGDGG